MISASVTNSTGTLGRSSRWRSENILLCVLVVLKVFVHLVASQNYGYFRDEFYYLKLGERVFQGPTAMPLLTPLLMAFNLAVLGDSIHAIRLWPALAGAVVIILAVLTTRELGGRLFAQTLAGTCTLLTPVFLGANSTFSYDSFDQLFWVLAFYVLVRLLKQGEAKLWLLFGLVAGLGLFTKETMLCLGFGIAVGFLVTPAYRYYATKWMWLGAGISFLFLVPYLWMQARLNWPTLSYWGYYASRKTYPVTPWQFLAFQVLAINPVTLPVWVSGLFFTLRTEAGRPYRPLGWTYLVLFLVFMVLRAKFYFLSPVYPFLFAAGAVSLEQAVRKRGLIRTAYAYLSLIILSGVLLAPFAAPLLPLQWFLRVAKATSGGVRVKSERLAEPLLPQHFADRFGWENMAAQVVTVFQNLPPSDQAKVCIFTGNYGEAGAIEFFGRKLEPRLPRVLSGHGQYFFWGPGNCTGEIMIVIGIRRADLERFFKSVTDVGLIQSLYCMPYENNLPIYLCRQPVRTLKEGWPRLAHFD